MKIRICGDSRGFTIVELVVVIVLLGILAAYALPKFFNLGDYQARAAYDEVAGALRYAQKLAVGSGCAVRVNITGNSYALQQPTGSCTSAAFSTITGHPINNGTISGTNLSSFPTSFTFDAMGRSSDEVTVAVGGRNIKVIAETGTVDAP